MSAMTTARAAAARAAVRPQTLGVVDEIMGLHVRVQGIEAALGELVELELPGRAPAWAEVVAARGDGLVCLPINDITGVTAGAYARPTGGPLSIQVGQGLRSRVLDGLGRPLDGRPLPDGLERVTVEHAAPPAMSREPITTQLPLGVRALDALVPCGVGQRLGIMAGSGVGKSTLLSMIARGTRADTIVLALVGERGREVREFIERDLGPEGLERAIVVVSTSDAPAVERLRSAFVATRIAEWFRDQGDDVLLMMDSLTRVAMAQREIGLSAGEPPTTRGYPPSAFSVLPKLLERTGPAAVGSITALYTVLVEGDDLQDPIGDAARSILDGHVVLDRRLATAGHFPSIDVLESISRLGPAVTEPQLAADATRARQLLAAHRDVRELVEIGAYVAGTDPVADEALVRLPGLDGFLRQRMGDVVGLDETSQLLREVLA